MTMKKSIARNAAAFALVGTMAFTGLCGAFPADNAGILGGTSITASAADNGVGTYKVNTSAGLNVRSSASTSGKVLGAAKNGTQFTVTKTSNGWGYGSISCTNGTQTGWVSLQYCTFVQAATTSVNYQVKITTKAGLNMRSKASTSGSVVKAIPYNTTVTVTKESNGWGYTTYSGKSGWILLSYTSKVSSSSSSSSSSSTGSVSLNVPSYKQYDSRWASTKIGTKTINQVGCVLTSVSMVYSYKNNTTVYPNAMKSKLTFSNNDVVWSSVTKALGATRKTYGNCAISQTIMKNIYNQLKAGKPVIIFNYSTSKGSYHAVVITGYSGSTSAFSASGFKINDPVSSSRTNLQQYLNTYNKVNCLVY